MSQLTRLITTESHGFTVNKQMVFSTRLTTTLRENISVIYVKS